MTVYELNEYYSSICALRAHVGYGGHLTIRELPDDVVVEDDREGVSAIYERGADGVLEFFIYQ